MGWDGNARGDDGRHASIEKSGVREEVIEQSADHCELWCPERHVSASWSDAADAFLVGVERADADVPPIIVHHQQQHTSTLARLQHVQDKMDLEREKAFIDLCRLRSQLSVVGLGVVSPLRPGEIHEAQLAQKPARFSAPKGNLLGATAQHNNTHKEMN
jgi:hypothetical protein